VIDSLWRGSSPVCLPLTLTSPHRKKERWGEGTRPYRLQLLASTAAPGHFLAVGPASGDGRSTFQLRKDLQHRFGRLLCCHAPPWLDGSGFGDNGPMATVTRACQDSGGVVERSDDH